MNKKKYGLFFVLSVALSLNVITFGQNSDEIKERAKNLLQNYQPPQAENIPEQFTPKEDWMRQYQYEINNKSNLRYADSVIAFSSEYSSPDFSAQQIIGFPDVYPNYGDYSHAWAPSSQGGQREWIEIYYKNPAPISNIGIYETFNPGAIDTIYVYNPSKSGWEVVWDGIAAHAGDESRIFEVEFPLTSFNVGGVRLALNTPLVAGWNEIDAVAISDAPINPLRANTFPSYGVSPQYGNALAGQPIAVWGNVHGGKPPYTYKLEYGDGAFDSNAVADPHYIGFDHTYSTAGNKTVTLTVWDSNGDVNVDQSILKVFAASTDQIDINMAIQKGLLYLYLQQYTDGHWADGGGGYDIGASGLALLSFEENGFLPMDDWDSDIYAEYVFKGLDYFATVTSTLGISPQYAGDPDSDGDGLGAYVFGGTYANGIGTLAIIGGFRTAADAMAATVEHGVYTGQSYYDIVVDALDLIAFSQTDSVSGNSRGGWRYNVNTANFGSSDNSAVQWSGLVLEAAENSWGMTVPSWVKNELLYWLEFSQDPTDGGFGYTTVDYWDNIAKTGSGIGSYAALGALSTDQVIVDALGFLDLHWNDAWDNYSYHEHLNGNFYAMYAVAKGMRIINHRAGLDMVGAHHWYDEYSNHLLHDASYGQQPDGSWHAGEWTSGKYRLATGFAILILTQGVVIPPPVAVISPLGSYPTNTSFQVDGSNSFHQDPDKSIIEWLWDWDASDGLDWDSPDATGQVPTNPGYSVAGNYTITLRVKDNSTPPMFDLDTEIVMIADTGNHPPVAVAIPPGNPVYAAMVGAPILLDGSYSYDPDYPADSVVVYNWDLDGDGVFGDANTDTVTVVFNNEYQGVVGLRVYDTHGDSSSNQAWINIVASQKDIYVSAFDVVSSSVTRGRVKPAKTRNGIPIIPGDTLHIKAYFENSDTSNTDVMNVLVRFYDEDPLTIGNRIGGDYFVDLPIGGEDSVITSIQLPESVQLGERQIYVYLDPNDLVSEWDEVNNLESVDMYVVLVIAPIDLSAVASGIQTVDLSWTDKSDNEFGFVIERKVGGPSLRSDYTVIDTVGANVTNFTDNSVADTTEYTYRVYAYNDEGNSDYSNQATVTTPIPVELASFAANQSESSVLITWSTATETNNSGFDIEKNIDNNWKKIGFVEGNGTTTEKTEYSYSDQFDENAFIGVVKYRLKQIDFSGAYSYSDVIEIDVDFTPKVYSLLQNYPNPFNPVTIFKYQLPKDSKVILTIYNILGEKIQTLIDGIQETGYYQFRWNAANLASGMYIYHLDARSSDGSETFSDSKKMLLLK